MNIGDGFYNFQITAILKIVGVEKPANSIYL
jgi:hypothetical protein